MNTPRTRRLLATLALTLCALPTLPVQAQTHVDDAWVRATVPQQQATGLFAHIRSTQGGKLVAVSSPVAALAEIHEMKMDGNVMRMRHLADGLSLPAGKTVKLEPGGYHIMLMQLKQQVVAGTRVPVTLVVQGTDERRESIELQVEVRALGAAASAGGHKH